ncbi:MAG: S-layer homology domain-containing protein [Clostridia bacterium]|nr:S-layer homology domain-containing protein [Clostridia bacterium]
MKKRIFSLLLALAMVLSLMPTGVWAADGNVTIQVDVVDEKTGDINESAGGQRTGPVLTSSDTNLSGQFYIVQGDVTINGDLTVDGSKIGGLVLCADATLTVTGALIYSGGSWFSIYGQTRQGSSQSTGKLIIENSNGDGAAIRSTASSAPSLNISSGELEIHGGSSEKLIDGVYLSSSTKVHKATLDDEKVFSLSSSKWNEVSLDGSKLVIEYCDHDDATYEPVNNTQHEMHCADCGFVGTAKDCSSDGFFDGYVSGGEAGHYQQCPCGNTFGTPNKHTIETVAVDGTYHITGCQFCDYTIGSREEHSYSNGECIKCEFAPVAQDAYCNFYGSVTEALEAVAKGGGTTDYVELVQDSFWSRKGDHTEIIEQIEFNQPGKTVNLKMNGHTLTSDIGPAITVEAGTLNITGAAVISQTGKYHDQVAHAIKVTGGALIFEDAVTATGSAAGLSAAPAIEVTGGTVTFGQAVTATAVENAGLDTAIAPAIKITGGKAVFNGKVTATGGLKGVSGNVMTCEPAIKANGGELEFNGDLDLNGGLTITGDAKLTKGLTQGTFKVDYGETVTGDRVSVVGSSVYNSLYSLLGTDRGFADPTTHAIVSSAMLDSQKSWAGDVTIVEHTHSYTNKGGYHECACGRSGNHSFDKSGACSVCGKPCDHTADKANTNGHWYCDNCGAQVYAYIQNGNIFDFYTTLKDALAAAENGQTVKLVDDIDQSNKSNNDKTACLTGDNKTVTLNLNGKNITGGWIDVGRDQDGTVINSSRLNITGSGSFDGMIGISAKGTLDLSDWDGGTIRTVDLSKSGNDECTLIVGEKAGTINTLSFYNWPSDKISNTKLTGGTYGSIPISMNSGVTSISFSDLLAPGYAFQYADGSGSFVNYATKATYDEAGVISDVKVVKCTSHEDADSDSHCDYCNTALDGMAASVTTDGTGAKTYYFSDLTAAFDAAADGATVRLLKNVTLAETLRVYKQVTLDLNGFTIDDGNISDGSSAALSVAGDSQLTIRDSSEAKTGAITNTKKTYAIYPAGTLNITGGNFGNVFLSSTSVVSGGTFAALSCNGSGPLSLGDALAKGYAFAQKDNPSELVKAYDGADGKPVTFLPNVTVVEHTKHEGSPCACGYKCNHAAGMNETTGKCNTCGSLLAVASVTVGETPAVTYYMDIHDAFNAAAASSDSTLKLLQNVTLEDGKDINISSTDKDCTFTVDWNGFTLSGNCYGSLLTFSGHTNVTLKDSGNNKGGVRNTHTLESAFSSLSGGIAVCISVDSAYRVTIEGGTYSARVWKRDCYGTLQISGGVFESAQGIQALITERRGNADGTLADLLAEGVTFAYDEDGAKKPFDVYTPFYSDAGKTVYVVAHTHGNFGNNDKCACGYTCLHARVDNNNICTVCGKTMVASVTQGETTSYYWELSGAIRAATGGTLTLLANAPANQQPSISANLTLDLNGFDIPDLRLGAEITLKDSGTTNKGVIGTLTINGSDKSIVLGDLMTGGDSLKNTTGWLTPAELLERTASNVSVDKTEISSVTANGPESVTYGETGKGFIVLTVAPNNLTNYTEQWFELKDGAWTQITGAGGTSYPPAALDAGSHTIRGAVKSNGGWVLSNAVTVTVTPASIAGANITLDHPSFVYDGAEKTPAVSSVTLNLTTLTKDTDYTVEVTGQTNAGSDYTLTVKGKGNYTGTATANWSITPKPVTKPTIALTGNRTYTGAEIKPAVTVKDGETKIPASEYTVEYSNNTNAGTATVIIHDAAGGNYTVSGDTTFEIEKATVSAPAAAELTVYNGLDKTYLVELPALPWPGAGCNYGNISYSTPTVAMTAEGYYTSGAAVNKDGKLLLPINAVTTAQEGKIGEVTVTVTTTNYNDITLTVNVSAANKIVPTAANVSATAITYGQPLSASKITGTMKDSITGAAVEGDFAWTDAQYTYKPAAGPYEAEWKFTPSGSNAYMYAATTGKVTVTVNKATMTATITQHTALTYNGKAQTADVDISVTTADKTTIPAFTYAATENGSYGSDIPTFIDAGEHKVYFRMTDPKGNHEVFSGSFTVTIDPKTVTAPTIALTGDRTYTGAEIKPTVTVKDGDTEIPASEYTVTYSGNINAGTATVTITDKDGGNYTVSGSTTFEIEKAASSCTAPAANSLTYNGTAQTLLTPGAATGGEMRYSLTENGAYSAAIPTSKNAGDYTVYYKVAGDANHNDTVPQSVEVTIGKAAVTVTAESKSSRVGKDLQPLTFTYAPELFVGDAFNGALATTADKGTVNDYPITQGSLTLGDNYQITFIEGTYSVLAKLPQASFRFAESAVEKTYGDGAFTLAATGEAENSAVIYSSSDPAIATVDAAGTVQIHKAGTVTITAVASETAEHLEGRVSYTLTVARKSVIITVLDKRAYTDSAAPDLSAPVLGTDYTVEGLLGSDTLRTGPTLTYDPAVPDMRKAGTAAKIVASDADAGENYQFTYVSGTLTLISRANPVGPAEPSVNPGEPDNGSITVSPKHPAKGSTVIITVEPDEGYELDEITITDKDGNALKLTDKGDGKYSFTMPSGKVDIDATFKKLVETSPFADVSTDAYYYEAVKWAAENNITGGIGNGLFGPELTCSRGQIVTFLWRAAGSPEPTALSTFTDVAADAYYAKAVAWAVENGVTTGTGDGKFSPDAPCTRGQAVTFLWRALGQLTGDTASFSDVPADSYFAQAVAWAAQSGVTTGVGNNLFAPGGDCTRAQIVTFLWRAYRQN